MSETIQSFKLIIKHNVKKLRVILKIMKSVAPVENDNRFADIFFKPEGVSFRLNMDNISLLEADYPASYFEGYECDTTADFRINLSDLEAMVRRFDDKEQVSLTLDAETSRFLVTNGKKKFLFNLIESQKSWKEVPSLQLPISVTTNFKAFSEMVADAKMSEKDDAYGDPIAFETKEGRFLIIRKTDTKEYNLEVGSEDGWKVNGEGRSTFSFDLITKIISPLKNEVETINLSFGSKLPLCLTFDDPYLRYYLAPRVKE